MIPECSNARRPVTGPQVPAPGSLEAWQSTLSRGGDPPSGRRVFFSAQTGSPVATRSTTAAAGSAPTSAASARPASREQIVHAVVRPSDEYSIDYQAWFIQTTRRR